MPVSGVGLTSLATLGPGLSRAAHPQALANAPDATANASTAESATENGASGTVAVPGVQPTQNPSDNTGSNSNGASGRKLTDQQKVEVQRLQTTDRAVRNHERAHMAAGGGLVTHGATYTYRVGPDGRRYAVGGEVGIDISEGRTPEETIRRTQQVRAAALAPADPSSQDRAVAAQAQAMAAKAQAELAREQMKKAQDALSGALSKTADESNDPDDRTAPSPSTPPNASPGIDIVA